jgi:hypothetical protein
MRAPLTGDLAKRSGWITSAGVVALVVGAYNTLGWSRLAGRPRLRLRR